MACAQIWPVAFFVHEVSLEHSYILSFTIVCGCCGVAVEEMSSWNRDHMACKT